MSDTTTGHDGRIRIGIGGWTFEPWRDNFYPPGLPHSQELHYASRQLSAIEINGTYYSVFKPATFAKWRDETPDGFVFSLKAHMAATNRRELGSAGDSVRRFLESGIAELGPKLGPIVWQFMPAKKFDATDFEAFLSLLPGSIGGLPLSHVLDVRHPSFACDAYLELARRYGCATVHSDTDKYPAIADSGNTLAYIRLMRSEAQIPTGYAPERLGQWIDGARAWTAKSADHEVFLFVINGAKERAPAAALELIRQLD